METETVEGKELTLPIRTHPPYRGFFPLCDIESNPALILNIHEAGPLVFIFRLVSSSENPALLLRPLHSIIQSRVGEDNQEINFKSALTVQT